MEWEAVANTIMNTYPRKGATPKWLPVEGFWALQNTVRVPQGLAIENREVLRWRIIRSTFPDESFYSRHSARYRVFSEGDTVGVMGYIAGTPHAGRNDPSTCFLPGDSNNTFRINIAAVPNDAEYDSIMVEMIPRRRNEQWTLEKLQRIEKRGLKVKVIGRLFYDNKHIVNADAEDPINGEAKRFSLWELHPVSSFELCPNVREVGCGAPGETGWMKLEDME